MSLFTTIVIIGIVLYFINRFEEEKEDRKNPDWRKHRERAKKRNEQIQTELLRKLKSSKPYQQEIDDNEVIMGLAKKKSSVTKAQEYILSEEWVKKKRSVLARDKYECQRCGVQNVRLSVHHKTYKNHYKENQEDLVTVCDKCHKALHDEHGYPDYDDEQDLITGYYFDT